MGLHEIRISAVKAWESEHISFPGDSSVCEVQRTKGSRLSWNACHQPEDDRAGNSTQERPYIFVLLESATHKILSAWGYDSEHLWSMTHHHSSFTLVTSAVSPKHIESCINYCGLPGGSDSKESACNAGDESSNPGLGRSPPEGNGNSLPYSCLENPKGRRAWQATVHGVAKSRTWLSD